MQIFTRKEGEKIIINDNICISILEVKPNNVCIGTTAPSEISVHREEIYRRIQIQKLNSFKKELEKVKFDKK